MRKSLQRGLAIAPFFLIFACASITATRPAQEMSNMEVSIKAAKEVNADVLAPELFRSAQESSLLARREYRYKNFADAKKYANQARIFAERAEFESLRNGAKREAIPVDPLSEPSYAPVPTGGGNADTPPATGPNPVTGISPTTTAAPTTPSGATTAPPTSPKSK